MSRNYQQQHLDRIAEEAAAWYVRLYETDVDAGDRKAFTAWLMASTEHVREFLQISVMWNDLSDLGDNPDIEQLIEIAKCDRGENVVAFDPALTVPESGLDRPIKTGRKWLMSGMLVAVFAFVAILFGVYGSISSPKYTVFQTGIGQQASFPLPDGSMVELNTQTEIRLHYTDAHRDIVLISGEVLFNVAKNPSRPFRVMTEGAVIQAVGTEFNVYHRKVDTTVTVVDGTIEVRSAESQPAPGNSMTERAVRFDPPGKVAEVPVAVTMGQQARVDARLGRVAVIDDVNIENITAWRERRLVFDTEPLSSVIDEFNLYNTPLMVISDPRLEQLPITGSFNAGDRASFILFLEKMGLATTHTQRDGTIVLRHKQPVP